MGEGILFSFQKVYPLPRGELAGEIFRPLSEANNSLRPQNWGGILKKIPFQTGGNMTTAKLDFEVPAHLPRDFVFQTAGILPPNGILFGYKTIRKVRRGGGKDGSHPGPARHR